MHISTFCNKNRTKTSLWNNKTDSKLLQKYFITNSNIYPRYYFKKHVHKGACSRIFVIKFLTRIFSCESFLSFKCWPNTQTLCGKVWSKGSSTIRAGMDNLGSNSRFPSVYSSYNRLCTSSELSSCLLLMRFAPKSAFL